MSTTCLRFSIERSKEWLKINIGIDKTSITIEEEDTDLILIILKINLGILCDTYWLDLKTVLKELTDQLEI